MTARELIAKLQGLNQDAEVVRYDDGGWVKVDDVCVHHAIYLEGWGEFQLKDKRYATTQEVVTLS